MNLLLGATGYVGSAFEEYFKTNQVPYLNYPSIRYGFDERSFINFILANNITHVYNCAGFTGKPNVDSCELIENKVPALQANALLPMQLLNICKKFNIKLIQISSGCIYNDTQCERGLEPTHEFTEGDEPNFSFYQPKHSWYSGTKALGEELIIGDNEFSDILICRLRIPFNSVNNSRNYLSKVISYDNLLNATNSFSQLEEFVAACVDLGGSHRTGIYNLTQPGYMTTKEIVDMLKVHKLITDKTYFKCIEDFEKIAVAPRSNCVLDSSKAIRSGVKLTPIYIAMEKAIANYKR
jgi:dTDP-4-dehydrorhamnose reductase